MRRLTILAVLCLSMTAAVASGQVLPDSVRSASAPAAGRGRHVRHGTRMTVLLGRKSVRHGVRRAGAGRVEAFRFVERLTGWGEAISVYVPAHSAAKNLLAGVYSDRSGSPGSLLASGSTRVPAGGGWATAAIRRTALVKDSGYWIAVLGKGGALDTGSSHSVSCRSVTLSEAGLPSMPRSWAWGTRSRACISAYVSGQRMNTVLSTVVGSGAPPTTGTLPTAGVPTTTGTTPVSVPSLPTLPPLDTGAPAITGTAQERSTLAATTGSWTANPSSYSYQWQDCAILCSNIPNATSATYALKASDVGDTIDVVVTAANDGGSTSATSARTATVQKLSAPSNTGLPVISGTVRQGQTLSASTGSWSGLPSSYAYEWQDCVSSSNCSNISGAMSASYTLQSSDVGDTIDVVVTATNAGGSRSATSGQTQAVTASSGGGGTGFSPLHVVGDKLVNAAGQAVALHGTFITGSSYACEQNGGYGFSDTPIGDSLYAPMEVWKMNSFELLLNQDCWLGINGVPAAYSGQNYIDFVKAQVASMEKYGIYPVLVFGEGAPGTDTPNWYATDAGEEEMPNSSHFPLLFEELATEFKNDPNVILKLYEEPYPNYSNDLSTWKCWSQGDVQYSTSSDSSLPAGWESSPGTQKAPTPTSSSSHCDLTDDAGHAYTAVGMQSLINVIRGTGATNVIQVPGVNFSNALSCTNSTSPTSCGFLDSADGVKVNDTLASPQLMADTDNYPGNGQFCDNLACVTTTYDPVAAVMPIDMGEIGPELSSPYSYSVGEQFIDHYDSLGQSYYGSQWETWSGMINDYNGTPGSGWGQWFHDHITAIG